ncbi:hypothetical protein EMIHUDRAFT_243717 [Emiliania huxleyi CCMP1516]|uniref:J domain-containing protein n=2 Tax=Emiliania huxleyi TaxID=2903 RepID=A0A0D3J4X7_EMIH1|nr:hypothetical protein EMIHUDRAFT_243717 [Emiliania huxleyi CCMP1516]EOD18562.1 hypothetical protein EMIHUDRAFT_243717 [Emiliania huxleyi CCMP1516]|eukprot:XP_005770991.1 hypothetical protein EMIHUDRAFT_243717 [Emiliania huxleyi CCMP1516]
MASHRIGARLSGLSPEQLVAFIDEQAPLWSAAAMRVAEEHAARLVEQPEWILSECSSAQVGNLTPGVAKKKRLSPAQLCAIIEAQAGASDAALRVAEEHAARLSRGSRGGYPLAALGSEAIGVTRSTQACFLAADRHSWYVEQPEWVLSEAVMAEAYLVWDLRAGELAGARLEQAELGKCKRRQAGAEALLAVVPVQDVPTPEEPAVEEEPAAPWIADELDAPTREVWLACVLAFEPHEAALRRFVQYIIEGPFIASASSLAASELSALPQPWVWSQPYPSTTKVFPKSYGTWMKKDAVAQGWIRVLFGGAGTVGLHRLGAPSQIPWHNADEQKFADIVSADPAKQLAAAWELAKMLVGSLDSDRAVAKAKTGAEGFAVDGLMLLMRYCKLFEDSVPPLQAAGVLDAGGPLDEAGRARNHIFHPSGATAPGESNFQLTQAKKEERIGKLEAVLGLVESWAGLPAGCGSAIAAAKAKMAEMKKQDYAIGDLRHAYEMYLQTAAQITAAQIADLKAEAGNIKDEVASLANGVAMLCAALPDDWREIAEGPLRKLGLDQLPERLDTLQAQLEQALTARLQVVEEKVDQTLAVAERTDAGVAALRAAAAAEQQKSQVQDELALERSLHELNAQRLEHDAQGSKLKAKELETLALAVKAGHVRLEDLGSASPTARRLSMQPQLEALLSIGGGGGAGATLPVASSSAGPSSSSSHSGGSTASSVMTITMEGSLSGPPPFDRQQFKEKFASKLDMTPEQLKLRTGYFRYESSRHDSTSSEDGSDVSDLSAAETDIQSAVRLALRPRRIALDAIEVLWTEEGSIIVCVKLDLPYALKLMDLYLRGDSSLKDELRVIGVGLGGAAAQPSEESMRQFDEPVRRVLFAPDHFAALGIARSATEREIVKAYRSVMRELHPDRQVSAAQAAEQPSDSDGAALLQQAREGTSLAAEGATPAAEQPSTLACGVAPLQAREGTFLAAEGASLAAAPAAPAAPAEPTALSGARAAEPAALDPDAELQRASAAAEAARAALEEAVASSHGFLLSIVDRLHPATSGVSDEKKNGWPRNLSDNYYELQGDCELHDITMRIHPNELGSRVAEMGGKPKRRVARTPNSDFFFQLQTKRDRFCPLALHGPSPAARLSGAL